jgi:hypothetical protein
LAAEDQEMPEIKLWRETVERLIANGASGAEAIDGANLILQAYRRKGIALATSPPDAESPPRDSTAPPPAKEDPIRASGVRLRDQREKSRAK